MNWSETLSTVLKVRRIALVLSAVLGGAGYKYGPTMWHGNASHPAAKPAVAANATANAVATTNGIALKPGDLYLGELTLTNHCETSVQLSNGKNCTLLPRGDGRNMELTVALKTSTSGGQTHDLSVTQVAAKSGKPVEVALGDFELCFTPKIEN
jgi:hypothetical protein